MATLEQRVRGRTAFSSQPLSAWGNLRFCTVTIPIGRTLSNTSYNVQATIERSGVPFACSVNSKTKSSFDLYVWVAGTPSAEAFTVNWEVSW